MIEYTIWHGMERMMDDIGRRGEYHHRYKCIAYAIYPGRDLFSLRSKEAGVHTFQPPHSAMLPSRVDSSNPLLSLLVFDVAVSTLRKPLAALQISEQLSPNGLVNHPRSSPLCFSFIPARFPLAESGPLV